MNNLTAIPIGPGGEITTPRFAGLTEPDHPGGRLRREEPQTLTSPGVGDAFEYLGLEPVDEAVEG